MACFTVIESYGVVMAGKTLGVAVFVIFHSNKCFFSRREYIQMAVIARIAQRRMHAGVKNDLPLPCAAIEKNLSLGH